MRKVSARNKTIFITDDLIKNYKSRLFTIDQDLKDISFVLNKTILGDSFVALTKIPDESVDLVITDPPYNIEKKFNKGTFKKLSAEDYCEWLEFWVREVKRIVKSSGSVYVCCDWTSSPHVYTVLSRYFTIRNRITWEREKGRSANKNWKNNIEDIYFASVSENYTFNLQDVMIKKAVLAPYKDEKGNAKDWFHEGDEKYRLTAPSNVWTDITVPYWSMSENTEHPTQKPEKLIAKLILASSNEGDIVFDPFLGSGTTSVVAKKLKRNYIGIEIDEGYASIAEKRLENSSSIIQGYNGNYFLGRGVK